MSLCLSNILYIFCVYTYIYIHIVYILYIYILYVYIYIYQGSPSEILSDKISLKDLSNEGWGEDGSNMFKRIKQNGWQRLAHFEVEHKCIIRNNSLVLIRGNKTRRKPWLLPEKYEETQTYVGQKDCSPTTGRLHCLRHVHSKKALATECHRITRETHGNRGEHDHKTS